MNVELNYHLCVFFMSILIFSMKYTAPNPYFELFLKVFAKGTSMFTMVYSVVWFFKYWGVI